MTLPQRDYGIRLSLRAATVSLRPRVLSRCIPEFMCQPGNSGGMPHFLHPLRELSNSKDRAGWLVRLSRAIG